MFIEYLLSIILNYNEFQKYGCLLHISNEIIAVNSTLLRTILSPDKTYSSLDFGIWDQCPNVMISSPNPQETFDNYEKFLRHIGYGMTERKYVIIFNSNQQHLYECFYQSRHLHFVADLIIILEFKDYFKLFTHKYVGTGNHSQEILLDVFFPSNNTFLFNNNLLPDKLSNVHGRILNIGAAKYVPLSNPDKMRGLETRFLQQFIQRYNYTLNFDKRERRLGLWFPNNSATGFTKLMLQDQLDLVSYGLYIQEARRAYGEFSFPMAQVRLTFIVPKPMIIDEWSIVRVLRYKVWLVMAFTYVVLILMFNLILRCRKHPSDKVFTNEPTSYLVLRIFEGQPHKDFMKNKDRILLGTLLTLMIIIHTFLTSKMASYNTIPLFKDQIDNIEDMANFKITWYTRYYDEIKSLETSRSFPLRTLYQTFRNQTPEESIKMINAEGPKSYAFAINQSFNSKFYTIFDYFTLGNLKYFQIIKGTFIPQYTALFMRRNSIILPSINKFWSLISQHGIAIPWEYDTFEGYELQIQHYLKFSSKANVEPHAITLPDVLGIIIIWCVGIGVSIVVFCGELVWMHWQQKKIRKFE